MVNLPKPILFESSAGIEVLPKVRPAHPSPHSSQSCCYRFGLPPLCRDGEAIHDNELHETLNELYALSQLLAIPSLFVHGDGQAWRHSKQHYPALLQWKEQHVPTLLFQTTRLLDKLKRSSISESATREDSEIIGLALGHVVCAVARYLFPTSVAIASECSPSSAIELEAHQDDGWTNETLQLKSQEILHDLSRQTSSSILPKTSTVAKALLEDYIKPIFRETATSSFSSTSSIDPDTGRKKPPSTGSTLIPHLDANLGQHRFQNAAEDNDASNFAPRRFALSIPSEAVRSAEVKDNIGLNEDALQSLVERNEALGCVNVLAWCLDSLQFRTESDWSGVWPLIVPPLLTLMEHPQPRFRLRGTVLAHHLLLRASVQQDGDASETVDVRTREITLGRILIRTGIGSLLERALHVNLTYVHDEQYAPALLSYSIGALRQLIFLTTHPVSYGDRTQLPLETDAANLGAVPAVKLAEPDDCGKRRMEALLRLVSEGILSTWSYLPLPPSSTRLGRELVNVTCTAYLTLVDDLATPPTCWSKDKSLGGMVRFLEVTLDWIFRSWTSNVPFSHTDHITTTINLFHLAGRLLFPAVILTSPETSPISVEQHRNDDQHHPPTTTRRFTSLVLSSAAKCWISALDSPLRTSTTPIEPSHSARWNQLQNCLSTFLLELSCIDSSVELRWAELVKLEQRLLVLLPLR